VPLSLPILQKRADRDSDADFARFAMGSATELEYLFILATSLGLIDKADYNKLHEKVVEIKHLSSRS